MNLRVLIVDDNVSNRLVAKNMVANLMGIPREEKDMIIHVAVDGNDAIEKFKQHQYDLC